MGWGGGERGHRERRKRKEDKGWWGRLAGRQEGRVRVCWEAREIDRITGFRSRTERDGRRQRRERERKGGGDSGSGRLSAFAKLTENNTLNPTIKKNSPPGGSTSSLVSIDNKNLRNSALNIHLKR